MQDAFPRETEIRMIMRSLFKHKFVLQSVKVSSHLVNSMAPAVFKWSLHVQPKTKRKKGPCKTTEDK